MEITGNHYRPEIDGLRALAVLAVVVFHLDRSWLPGGFVGVDVFFVISGYLITSIILRDQRQGTFSFGSFYQRRIARIFPAFLAVAMATLLAACGLYSSQDFAAAGTAFSAALLSTANVNLLLQGDYFALSADAQPLLHCWSLAVEEQFYLLFPFALWLAFRMAKPRTFRLLALAGLLSLGCGVFLTYIRPGWAFYLLPARAWELLAGSLLAAAPVRQTGLGGAAAPAAGQGGWLFWAGLVLILGSFGLIRENQAFPGWVAMVPVLGTVAVLAAPPAGRGQTLLGCGPLRGLGKRSYSLYLWHWPVFSFVDYTMIFSSPGARLAVKLVLTAAAAAACYAWIERPCRHFLNRPEHRKVSFLMLAAALAILAPLGFAVRRAHYVDASDGRNGELVFPQTEAQGTLVLMGDSQGSMYGPLARRIAREKHLRLVVLSVAGGDPLAVNTGAQGQLWMDCLAAVRREKPDCLLLACHWGYKLASDPARLESTLAALAPHARRIVLLTQPPVLPVAAERASIRKGAVPPFFEDPASRRLRQQVNAAVKGCAGGRVVVIDVEPWFSTSNGALILTDSGGKGLFQDRVHLSGAGACLLKPAILKAMETAASGPAAAG